jgi:hypothetical protein
MEAAGRSETSVFVQQTQRQIPENKSFHSSPVGRKSNLILKVFHPCHVCNCRYRNDISHVMCRSLTFYSCLKSRAHVVNCLSDIVNKLQEEELVHNSHDVLLHFTRTKLLRQQSASCYKIQH